MKYGKIIAWVGLIFMTYGLINGFVNGDFLKDGALLFENPWGVMSLIDLYVGFTLFSMWIAFRETSLMATVIWIILMMTLGFFAGCLYVLVAFYTSQGNWMSFFFGKRKEKVLANEK